MFHRLAVAQPSDETKSCPERQLGKPLITLVVLVYLCRQHYLTEEVAGSWLGFPDTQLLSYSHSLRNVVSRFTPGLSLVG